MLRIQVVDITRKVRFSISRTVFEITEANAHCAHEEFGRGCPECNQIYKYGLLYLDSGGRVCCLQGFVVRSEVPNPTLDDSAFG
jgi:hypothetical protein